MYSAGQIQRNILEQESFLYLATPQLPEEIILRMALETPHVGELSRDEIESIIHGQRPV